MMLWELTKRNVKIYIRDKGAVFFSVMSMLITIALMLFFLGDMQIERVVDIFSAIPGRDAAADRANATVLVLNWIAAGLVSTNAVTVTLAVYSTMLNDRTEGRLDSIYTAPVSRLTISSAYVISAWLCSVAVCTLTLVISEIFCIIKGGEPYSVAAHLKLIGFIAVNSFTYAAIMYLLAMLAKTSGAWGGLGTVIGTLVGFIGGIYLPIGNYSEAIATGIKCLPVIYGAKLFRNTMTADAENALFNRLPSDVIRDYRLELGTDLEFMGKNVTDTAAVLVLLAFGIIFLAVGVLVTRFSKKTDR